MPVRPRARFARPRRSPSAVLRKGWHERKDRHRCAITSMALGPRGRAAAAPRRGRLRGSRPYGATTLRCAVRGRTAELAARPAAALLGHAAVSQKVGALARAAPAALCCSPPRPMPAPAGCSHRSQSRPRLGQQAAPHLLRVPRSGMRRSPACHAMAFAARSGRPALVPAPSGGAVSSAGGGAARDRAPPLLTHGPCSSAASPRDAQRVGRAPRLRAAQRSRPVGPTATPGRNQGWAPGSGARHA